MAGRTRRFDRLAAALAVPPGDVRELSLSRHTSEPLPTLPPAVFDMVELEHLRVDGLGLQSLPPELGRLTRLKELALPRNQLRALPPEVGLLRRLNELDLTGNPAMDLPPELFTLRANRVQYPEASVLDVAALVAALGVPEPSSPLTLAPAADILARFGVLPALDVAVFAAATREVDRLPGPFSLLGWSAAPARTFAELWGFHEYGAAPLPAVLLGGDGRGTEFWLGLADGAVLSIHHDALFELAHEARQRLQRGGRDNPEDLMRELVATASVLDLRALLYLQLELPRLGVLDWATFLRKPPSPADRRAVFRLACIGRRISPGHLRAAPKWQREASRFIAPLLRP